MIVAVFDRYLDCMGFQCCLFHGAILIEWHFDKRWDYHFGVARIQSQISPVHACHCTDTSDPQIDLVYDLAQLPSDVVQCRRQGHDFNGDFILKTPE